MRMRVATAVGRSKLAFLNRIRLSRSAHNGLRGTLPNRSSRCTEGAGFARGDCRRITPRPRESARGALDLILTEAFRSRSGTTRKANVANGRRT